MPKPAKHFWAFPVWDYEDERVKILEITQASIQKPIKSLVDDENWGDPKEYDIVIKRTGKELDTEYTVTPIPHKAMQISNEGETVLESIKLEKLFDGEDPFETVKVEDIPFG